MSIEESLVSDIVLREVSDAVLKQIPVSVRANWRMARQGKPQIVVDKHQNIMYSYDNGGIIITSDKYVCTTKIDRQASAIIHHLFYQPVGSIENSEIHNRCYSLSDPLAIEKAVGFIVKVISEYISPFKKI